METWCNRNCNHNPLHCPQSHCKCSLLEPWQNYFIVENCHESYMAIASENSENPDKITLLSSSNPEKSFFDESFPDLSLIWPSQLRPPQTLKKLYYCWKLPLQVWPGWVLKTQNKIIWIWSQALEFITEHILQQMALSTAFNVPQHPCIFLDQEFIVDYLKWQRSVIHNKLHLIHVRSSWRCLSSKERLKCWLD